jgi:hypothetical protein
VNLLSPLPILECRFYGDANGNVLVGPVTYDVNRRSAVIQVRCRLPGRLRGTRWRYGVSAWVSARSSCRTSTDSASTTLGQLMLVLAVAMAMSATAVVFGGTGLSRARARRTGKAMAIAGLICGWLQTLLVLAGFAVGLTGAA